MFVVSPRLGLCNQLFSIVKSILLGVHYGRNVYISQFQKNYGDYNSLCDINEILNIDKINNFLLEHNVYNCKVISSFDLTNYDFSSFYMPNVDYERLPHMNYINNYIDENLHKEIIYLGNPVSLCINQSFGWSWNDYTNLYYLLSGNSFFQDKFYALKDEIKCKNNLYEYATVHLRIEDDMLDYASNVLHKIPLQEYNDKLLGYYNNKISNINKKIYVCSGILSYNNTINYDYYRNLKNNNNLICDKEHISIEDYYTNNRELISIVDLLIAYDSNEFVGCIDSTFSLMVCMYFTLHNKNNTDLFRV